MSMSSGTKTIDVLYTASGQKLRKTVTDNGVLQYRQDYVSGIEYRYTTAGGLTMEAVYHAEGRVYNNGGTLRYEYSIRDHLGNTRLTFTDKNANGVVDVTSTSANEILQENHFYPFGLDVAGPWMNDAAQDNLYKYNGKELNGDFGLNWMDYGARWYDGSLGRWWNVDLMAGLYQSYSPISYTLNNPLKFIDPNGMFTSWNPGINEMKEDSKREVEEGREQFSKAKALLNKPDVFFSNSKGFYIKDGSVVLRGKLLQESFDFQDVTGNWQEAIVEKLKLSILDLKGPNGERYNEIEFNIEVGVPKKLVNGEQITRQKAAEKAAFSANMAAIALGYDAKSTVERNRWFGPDHEIYIPNRFVEYMSLYMTSDGDGDGILNIEPSAIPGARVRRVSDRYGDTSKVKPHKAIYDKPWDFTN